MLRLYGMVFALLMALPGLHSQAEEWREFRGPDGTGHYTGKAVPTEWGPTTNVTWKIELPGEGWSSPILVEGKLYLTNAVPVKPGSKDLNLNLLCVDAQSGKLNWTKTVFLESALTAPSIHKKNSHASPTPVSDGTYVVVHYGHMGTACYKLDGTQVWATQKYAYTPQHGNGGSPILVDGQVVFSCDGTDYQYVVALDLKTGAERWKTDRNSTAGFKFSFATAQLIEHNGTRQVISAASDFVASYDPKSGKELWRVDYPKPGWSVITRPVYGHGLVFISSGYVNQHLLAIDPSGQGNTTKTNIKWMYKKHAPNTPTPLLVGEELYSVSDSGTLVCFDAKTGKVYWEERVKGGAYSSSPTLMNGLIYMTSENGTGLVIEPSKEELKVLHESSMKEKTFATFLPHDGALYLRTESALFKFEDKK